MNIFSLKPFDILNSTELNLVSSVSLSNEEIFISFQIDKNLEKIDLGEYTPNKNRLHKLWEKTCFEFFLKAPNNHYIEFNFSPNFSWNAYFFEVIRGPLVELDSIKQIETDILNSSDKYVLVARIKLSDLPQIFKEQINQCSYGITSVIKTKENSLEYWAIKHCDSRPNFHLYESFIGKF